MIKNITTYRLYYYFLLTALKCHSKIRKFITNFISLFISNYIISTCYIFMIKLHVRFLGRQYKVMLDLAKPPRAESWVQGFMKVSLHSDNGVIRNLDLTPK